MAFVTKTKKRFLFFSALFLGGVVVLFVTFIFFRKPMVSTILDQAIHEYTGLQSITEVKELHWTGCVLFIQLPRWKIDVDDIQIRWQIHHLWNLELGFQLSYASSETKHTSFTASDYKIEIEGQAKGGTPEQWRAKVAIKNLRVGETSFSNISVLGKGDPDGMVIETETDTNALGKVRSKIDVVVSTVGEEALYEGVLSGKSQLGDLQSPYKVTARKNFSEFLVELPKLRWKAKNSVYRKFLGESIDLKVEGELLANQFDGTVLLFPFKNKWVETKRALRISFKRDGTEALEVKGKFLAPTSTASSVVGQNEIAGFSLQQANLNVQIQENVPAQFSVQLEKVAYGWGKSGQYQALSSSDGQISGSLSKDFLLEAKAELKEISHLAKESLTNPMKAKLSARGKDLIQFDAELLNWVEEPIIRGKGEWNRKQGWAKLHAKETWDFDEGFDPADISPALARLKPKEGKVKLDGNFAWNSQGGLEAELAVGLDAVGVEWDGIPISGLDGGVKFNRLFPPSTASWQTVSVKRVGNTLPVSDTVLQFKLDGKGGGEVKEARLLCSGGEVKATPFSFTLKPVAFKTHVILRNVDMESFLTDAKFDRIQARGRVDGDLPISYEGDFLHIKQGVLRSSSPEGWVHYEDETLVGIAKKIEYMDQFQALMNRGQQALAFKALDNFFFKQLSIEVNRTPAEGLQTMLKMEGKNPDLGNGLPFKFSISLTGQVENAVKESLMGAMMTPEAFSEKIQQRQGSL